MEVTGRGSVHPLQRLSLSAALALRPTSSASLSFWPVQRRLLGSGCRTRGRKEPTQAPPTTRSPFGHSQCSLPCLPGQARCQNLALVAISLPTHSFLPSLARKGDALQLSHSYPQVLKLSDALGGPKVLSAPGGLYCGCMSERGYVAAIVCHTEGMCQSSCHSCVGPRPALPSHVPTLSTAIRSSPGPQIPKCLCQT